MCNYASMASFVIFTRVQSQSLDYMCWTRFLSKFACEQHSALFVRTYVCANWSAH